jgi:ATP-dependent Clp protease protease subunit
VKKYLKLDHRLRPKAADLIDQPVVIKVNKFTEDAHQVGQPIIPVVICSYGGSIDPLVGMITEIQNSQIPVATIVESKAMSAGALLFSFGAPGHRYMAPHARIMLHGVSSFSGGQAGDLKVDAEETDRLNDMLFHLMAKNCGKEPDYFLDRLHDGGNVDWYLDAKEAKKHGICSHIKVPCLTVSINVDINFG